MKFLLLIFLGLISIPSFADSGPFSFTYQGKILNAAGTAALANSVSLTLGIYNPSVNCLLYEETQGNIALNQTNGVFSIQVGSATTAPSNAKRTVNDPGLSMIQIFSNSGTSIRSASSANCSLGYTPQPYDGRVLRVTVTAAGISTVITPDLNINAVPNAMVAEYASIAKTVQGLSATDLALPVGSLLPYAGVNCPAGYLLADGTSYAIATYPNLASSLYDSSHSLYVWGSADSSHFNVPDLRGRFIRGVDNSAGRDPDRTSRYSSAGGSSGNNVGSYQDDMYASHNHSDAGHAHYTYAVGTTAGNNNLYTGGALNYYQYIYPSNLPTQVASANIQPSGGSETRPKNANVNYCVKY